MKPRTAIAFGEAVIDCHADRRLVAGAPLHVAVHLARRGWTSYLVTAVGRDEDGRRILERLAHEGVRTELVQEVADRPTGTVQVVGDLGGHRFEIAREVAWDAIALPESLPPHELFAYGTLAARAPRSGATLIALLERSAAPWKLFDVNLRPPDALPDVIRAGLAEAHVLKMAEDEVAPVAAAAGLEPRPAAFFAALPALRYVCVTKGAEGAVLVGRDGRTHRVGPAAITLRGSTVGAGDAFAAGLAHALATGASPEAALAEARSCAGRILEAGGGLG